jgi:hypothetical protein
MMETVFTTVYLVLGVGLTGYGAWMVLRTGRVFLEEGFQRNAELVRVMSHVLTVSFCVVMGGYLLMAADFPPAQPNANAAGNAVFWQQQLVHFGGQILFLGVDLFFHLFLLSRMRGRAREERSQESSALA